MWKLVCRPADVPRDGMKQFEAEGGPACLVLNTGGEYFAYQALCPHMDVKLEEGIHDGTVLTCLEHLWQFDIRTGAALGDAEAPVRVYEVKREGDALYVWDPPA